MDKKETGKNLIETLDEAEQLQNLEQMIKNGKIIFPLKDKTYRIRKPTYEEQIEVESFRRKKYLEYIKDKSMLRRKDWIKLYKEEKGIDIDQMEGKILQLEAQKEKLEEKLATSSNDADIKALKKEIQELKLKQMDINMEKTDLLSYSIEDQLMIAVNSYYTYVVLEVKKDDKWERAFKTYEEFSKSNDNILVNRAFYYINYLIYNPLI